ncbi:MAG: lipid-A-disaccharide synthase [Omnitrophica bacterium RIFCSPLOWO2_12_FULL_44_17]|uniref:Lipid-A-disaccharide synthase n=1 Tax=Candidatus Danuiimicrobium aquiferis TaxID=1801832 RepID=A0A1G1KSH7_9BACT|nr:MAG: lipid-A-disaccharide synthase [Omnitrophica bacterium RIFCSPHIGHO2_02_FULL_45_28]OGW90119.1 MAG: lipid-A-disaccharide synthase [Omnitrophica bacterium RIFCSPHIGHO2_12_FULL_44_12]OGW95893.1 MAG: lipid-A-disaccharide synthase [Omnitrophica bacterium RIFCSPLOWO2_12_FULL_44_17]OGX01892.1 MAG: lipid-A-disaccharide synthase [Omnitrophica bacterium RIFCSPLOWO2_02_FULL_44_11]
MSTNQLKKIFLIAGEASGDLHGALLIKKLKTLYPDIILRGLGGPLMKAEGVQILHDLTKESVLGATDVFIKYFHFLSIFKRALKDAELFKPDAIILIDYPGFNLRFAKKINNRFPVIYYISPQIWAWGKRRIHVIKKFISHMIVLFQFEADMYRKFSVPATWVGHPLIDEVKPSKPRIELRKELFPQAATGLKVVTLFPGSRKTEVERILPDMLKTAQEIKKCSASGAIQFLLAESSNISAELYDEILNAHGKNLPIKKFENRSYDLLAASDAALITSGTATLETALSKTPFVIFYKTARLTFWLGRWLVNIPFIGLVNVVAGKKIIPEFLQHEIRPELIAKEIFLLLHEEDLRKRMIQDLEDIKIKLGLAGAAGRAAETVVKLLTHS